MSHAEYLRDLLRPLGVYNLEAPFNGGELDAQGAALDGAMARIEEVQRESSLTTAEGWGWPPSTTPSPAAASPPW